MVREDLVEGRCGRSRGDAAARCGPAPPDAAGRPSPAPVPEAGADGLGEVAGGDEVAVVVDGERAAGAATGSAGPKIGRAPSSTSKVDWWHGQSSSWLVGLVEPDRAADVGADLRVGDVALCGPVLPAGAGPQGGRPAGPDEQRRGVAGAVGPSGKTVRTPSTARSSARTGRAVGVDQPGAGRRQAVALQGPPRRRARASGSGTARPGPAPRRRPRSASAPAPAGARRPASSIALLDRLLVLGVGRAAFARSSVTVALGGQPPGPQDDADADAAERDRRGARPRAAAGRRPVDDGEGEGRDRC